MLKDKKIVMFFNGKEDSNRQASQLMISISKSRFLKENLDIDFVNLSKRNINNFIKKLDYEPDLFYIYNDDIELVNILETKFSHTFKIRNYSLLEGNLSTKIIKELKDDFGMIKKWRIDSKSFKPEYIIINIVDAKDLNSSWKNYISKEDCMSITKEYIEEKIEETKRSRDICIQKNETYNKLLKEFLKEF